MKLYELAGLYGTGVLGQTLANQFIPDDRETNPFIAGLTAPLMAANPLAGVGALAGNVAGTIAGSNAGNYMSIIGGLAPLSLAYFRGKR